MRKTFFLLAFISVTSFFISCKKDPPPVLKECYTIPFEKNLTVLPKVGQKLDVEWETTDGRGANFSSSVNQERPIHVSGSVKTHSFVVNGTISNSGATGTFVDNTNPLIIMIVNEDTVKNEIKFWAFKPILYKTPGQSSWNNNIPSPCGTLETLNDIQIVENSMSDPNGDGIAMCMKITLKK